MGRLLDRHPLFSPRKGENILPRKGLSVSSAKDGKELGQGSRKKGRVNL